MWSFSNMTNVEMANSVHPLTLLVILDVGRENLRVLPHRGNHINNGYQMVERFLETIPLTLN